MPFQFLTNGVFIAIIAHGMIGVSLIWDKILLQRPATKTLANYVFWLGALSILGVLLIPFGFKLPSAGMAGLAVGTGALQLGAIWFYYAALQLGEASEALTVMGGFAPLATALIAIPLLSKPLGGGSLPAFALMVAGGFAMFAAERMNWRQVLPSVLMSAALFGLINVLEKIVFNATGFVTGYVFFTVGTFLGAMALLVRPLWRRQILEKSAEATPTSKLWYFVNRFISGVGSFLIFFAISRASPAVVAAIAGVRYAVVFVGALLVTKYRPEWLEEDFQPRVLIGKSIGTGMIVGGLVLFGIGDHNTDRSGVARVLREAPDANVGPRIRATLRLRRGRLEPRG